MNIVIACAMAGLIASTVPKEPEFIEPDFVEPYLIRCTCYCDQGYTKSGQYVREGIAAMNNEMLGKTAILYTEDMEMIGIYEILDTGGHKDLKNGTRIDVYRPTLEACYEWIAEYGDYVYVQILDADG